MANVVCNRNCQNRHHHVHSSVTHCNVNIIRGIHHAMNATDTTKAVDARVLGVTYAPCRAHKCHATHRASAAERSREI